MAKKEEKIYVVGHKNPDTDSICSAIAYANLKREITGNDYVAKRAGQINEETHYVLQKFGVKVPTLLENVKLQVKDMDIHQIDGIGPNVSMKDTWIKMKENNQDHSYIKRRRTSWCDFHRRYCNILYGSI